MTTPSLVIALLLSASTTAPTAPTDSLNASPAWSADSLGIAHIAGTDRPLRISKVGRDYELDFPKYRIRVSEGREAAGESIRVIPMRVGKNRAPSPPRTGLLVAVAEESAWFYGVAGDFLFIDFGCCPPPRGLMVYDLARRTPVFETDYMLGTGDPNLREGRWLSYVEAVDAPPSKPECVGEVKEWLDQGGEIGYEEDVVLDLQTMKVTRSGTIRCSPRQ